MNLDSMKKLLAKTCKDLGAVAAPVTIGLCAAGWGDPVSLYAGPPIENVAKETPDAKTEVTNGKSPAVENYDDLAVELYNAPELPEVDAIPVAPSPADDEPTIVPEYVTAPDVPNSQEKSAEPTPISVKPALSGTAEIPHLDMPVAIYAAPPVEPLEEKDNSDESRSEKAQEPENHDDEVMALYGVPPVD